MFKVFSDCLIKACRSLKWRAILKILILKEPMLFLLALKWNLYKKAFYCVKTKTNSVFARKLAEMLKEATIYFFLIDESHFSNICTLQFCDNIIYRNWLSKHRKKVRISQACISINSCTESSKTKFTLWALLSIVKRRK